MKRNALPKKIFSPNIGRALTVYLVALAISLSFPAASLSQYQCDQDEPGTFFFGSINVTSPDQITRLPVTTAHVASTCLLGYGAGTMTPGLYGHNTHVFTNTSGLPGCALVRLNTECSAGNAISAAAYSSFNPATPETGIIGQVARPGMGQSPAYFSFRLAAGASATIVVTEAVAGAGCPEYSMNVFMKT